MEYRGYGSSPRARGTGNCANDRWTFRRFIPACAGNSWAPSTTPTAASVHPRVRGEQGTILNQVSAGTGSSPRARGTASAPRWPPAETRFIPACAGNSPRRRRCTTTRPVHPRVRGEQARHHRRCGKHLGSSPRARGTVFLAAQVRVHGRFIPACAGNSPADGASSTPAPVHPRVRGEQRIGCRQPIAAAGSSPRARGTGHRRHVLKRERRFIPACAGNSSRSRLMTMRASVHPRVRGEQPSALTA